MIDLSLKAKEIASSFRLGKFVEAETLLPDYFNQLVKSNCIEKDQLSTVITCIVNSQERKDWLGLADYLEFELVHLLEHPA